MRALIAFALVGCSFVVDVDRFNKGGPIASDAGADTAVSDTGAGDAIGRVPRIYVAGGNVEGANEKTVLTATIGAGGVLSDWTPSGDLPVSSTSTSSVRSGDNVFIVGPDFVTLDAITVRFAKIAADGSLLPWAGHKGLPPRGKVTAAANASFVYAIGGINPDNPTDEVYRAAIGADGTPGNFTSITPLPVPRAAACAVVVGDRLFVMGGYTTGDAGVKTAIASTIAADGSLMGWSNQGDLSFQSIGCSAVAVGRRVFVVGGYGAQDEVQHALIDASGNASAWVTGSKMTSTHAYFQAAVAGGYLVAVSGFDRDSKHNPAVDVAPISEAGVGMFTAGKPLPKGRTFVDAFGVD